MLFVMLFGAFPFEHVNHPNPNTQEAHVEVWLQQQHVGWRSTRRAKTALAGGALSPEATDLLDSLFELDEVCVRAWGQYGRA